MAYHGKRFGPGKNGKVFRACGKRGEGLFLCPACAPCAWAVLRKKRRFKHRAIGVESAERLSPAGAVDRQAASKISLALARLYFERKNYSKALHLFFDLLNREESFTEALYGLSWCYIALGNYTKAKRVFVSSSTKTPNRLARLKGFWFPCGASASRRNPNGKNWFT